MARIIPQPLKTADIARFAHRAGQLEKAKPVIAYYCYYWIIDQVISKGLHKTDSESMTYTTDLMDRLEQMKADFADNDAITDSLAGHAYVEQFGSETLQRAENAMKANKVTRQTADTFQAAAAFLDLGQIWGPLEPEVAAKIKFAKYHAVRIAKAIRAGEDPNLSNPAPEPEPVAAQPLDPSDPEVQMINGTISPRNASLQPSVEDVPDDGNWKQPDLPPSHNSAPPPPPSTALSIPSQPDFNQPLSPPEQGEDFYTGANQPDVSPLGPSTSDRKSSVGGGYFPSVPDGAGSSRNAFGNSPIEPVSPPDQLPTQQPSFPPAPNSTTHMPDGPVIPSNSLHSFPPPNMDPDSNAAVPPLQPPPTIPNAQTFSPPNLHPPKPQQAPNLYPTPMNRPESTSRMPFASNQIPETARQPPAPVAAPRPPVAHIDSNTDYQADEEAILAAQKHARWAISALNFEDVKTAVKELRGALESLGAS